MTAPPHRIDVHHHLIPAVYADAVGRLGITEVAGRVRDAADGLDVLCLHYDALRADLEGQMRELATHLGIEVDEDRWPRLVDAATFESMRDRADTTVPGGGREHWIDPAAFFSRGTSGQWRDLLDDADLARYGARVRALASDDLVEWLHREPID